MARLGASSGHTIQRSASLDSSTAYKSIVEAQQQSVSLPPSQSWTQTHNKGPTSRPQPTLDMNFTGSFNGEHDSSNHSNHIPQSHDQSNYPIATSGPPHSGFIKDEHPPSPPYQYQFGDYNSNNIKQMLQSPATNSPSGYDSPGSAASYGAALPQIPHSQPPSSHYYYVHTPQTTTPVSATSVTAPTSGHTFNREQEPLPPQELDFMNLGPGQASGLDGSNQNNHGTDGVQMLPPTSNQATTVTFGGLAVPPSVGVGAPAIELGFGMGIDLQQQHDWSEGLGYDLFDGYFFGASGGHPNFQG